MKTTRPATFGALRYDENQAMSPGFIPSTAYTGLRSDGYALPDGATNRGRLGTTEPSKSRMKFVIYKDSLNEWRWTLYASNGKIMADSGEGYKRRTKCHRAIVRIILGVEKSVIENKMNADQKICRSCGAPNEVNDDHCWECGQPL